MTRTDGWEYPKVDGNAEVSAPAPPLQDRVAIVTGGARGIGRAIVEVLARAGAAVLVNDLSGDAAEVAARQLRSDGMPAVAHVGDLAHPDVPDEVVAAAVREFGTVDVVVNNAGYSTYGSALELTDAQWQPMLDVLLTAPFRLLRAAGPYLVRPADHARKVVNVSSVAGVAGSPGAAGYAAAKAGVHGLTLTLAKEWGPHGVTVNTVAPGLIRTRLTEGPAGGHGSIDVGDGRSVDLTGVPLDDLEPLVPLRRIGTPEDVAGAVLMFCLPQTDYVSGELLVVGGGWLP